MSSMENIIQESTIVNGREKVRCPVVTIECADRRGFEIMYLANFCGIFDMIGGKKYQVLKYLLEHRNSDNQVLTTSRELARDAGVSTDTVTKTLALLKACGAITTRTGVIAFNPKIINRGSKKKEAYLITKFKEMQTDAAK